MDWQQAVSLFIVAVTAVLLLGSRWRRRGSGFKRDTACGCAAAEAGARGESMIFRARKGARPEIRIKLGSDSSRGLRSRSN